MGQWTICLSCVNKGKRCQMELAQKDNDECSLYEANDKHKIYNDKEKNNMTRSQAMNQLILLSNTIEKVIPNEDKLEDAQEALAFALADMETLQDILTAVNGVITE